MWDPQCGSHSEGILITGFVLLIVGMYVYIIHYNTSTTNTLYNV